jgi:hypothetical protein
VITFVFRAESSAHTRVPDLTRTQKHGTEHPRALLLACVSLLFSFLTSLSRLCAWMICSGYENFACCPCYPVCTMTNCSHRHLVAKHPASARNPTTHNLHMPSSCSRTFHASCDSSLPHSRHQFIASLGATAAADACTQRDELLLRFDPSQLFCDRTCTPNNTPVLFMNEWYPGTRKARSRSTRLGLSVEIMNSLHTSHTLYFGGSSHACQSHMYMDTLRVVNL